MPHEHVNSSIVDATLDPTAADPDHPNGIMRVPHRVVVSWNRPAAPHAYADPEDGYVQLMSEWLNSEARLPSPKIVDVELRPHRFVSAGDDNVCVAGHCGYESRHPIHDVHKRSVTPDPRPAPNGPGTGSPLIDHVYKPMAGSDPDPDMDPCDFCGRGKHDSHACHVPATGQPMTVKTAGEPTWSESCTGLAVTLTRADLNRLIKMLRRARDEAYGADA